uniref:non-specific serine/threonine protein kinase n=1 Tax=Solanum lycopersicum TaxID=4081 RepID=K4D030_SOLLC|nr:clade XVII lectin receptor kinase [Solanum lycopersicum]
MVVFASLSSLKYFLLIPLVTSLSFNFDTFTPNDHNVTYERDASPENGGETKYGDGFAFFLAPAGSTIPYNTTRGGSLGLTSNNERLNLSINHFVAVEFDTYQNPYDPKGDHMARKLMPGLTIILYRKILLLSSLVFNHKRIISVTVLQNLSYNLDLREYLPEWVTFVFTDGAGRRFALQRIYSWNFTSSLDNMTDTGVTLSNIKPEDAPTKTKLRLVVGLICGGSVLVAVCTLVLFAFWRKSKEEMLGRGGFGGVHKGYLSESTLIFHEKRELLLVYEFMPNSSLDTHIFSRKIHLEWPIRFKISQGLASALLHLHEEWEQCVVHRDIKSTNIMLDSNYNAKLGDFGLARLVEHGKGSETTVLAGTMGYMAPECVTTGKANKETDVYSFGIVVLEIGCGRKPIDPKAEEHQVNIVDWVWRLYEMIKSSLSIQVLNFEAPLPTLPRNLPVPTYCSFSRHLPTISVSSKHETNFTETALAQIQHSVNKNNSHSSINKTSSSSTSVLYPSQCCAVITLNFVFR